MHLKASPADGDMVMDRLPDGWTDESNDVQMERRFPRLSCFRKFHTAILMSIFTMNLANGWMDGTDDRHTDGQTEFQVNHVWVDRKMSHVTDIWTDLLC